RLVLPAGKKQEAPYLQGWAVVENPSDEDWNQVRMALVSGRPISFKMDLYTPLYVPPPTVVPQLFASLNPVAYSGSLEGKERNLADLGRPVEKTKGAGPNGTEAPPPPSKPRQPAGFGLAMPKPDKGYADQLHRELGERLNLGRSVSSAAIASRLGDY